MRFFDITIVSMLCVTALSNCVFALIAPFLPIEFQQKSLDQSLVGYIFSIYSIAVIITSSCIGKLIKRFGRRSLIQIGVLSMGLSCIGFGTLNKITNKDLYISLAFVIRLVQGFSSSCIQTTCYSICTNFYTEKRVKLIGYIEASIGIGFIIGPIVGSVLYQIGGFTFTFYTFGTIFLIFSVCVRNIFPSAIDKDFTNRSRESLLQNENDQSQNIIEFSTENFQIGYMDLLKIPRFTLAAITATLGYFLYSYIEPILAYRLIEFQLSQIEIGFFFAIFPVFYIAGSFAVQFVPSTVQKRAILIVSCAACFAANLLIGPSYLFGFPNSLLIMGIGQAFLGFADILLLVPTLPEMIDSALIYYPNDEMTVNDYAAGIFNSFLGIGQILGPIFGSLMTKYTNYQITTDCAAFIMLFYSLQYFKFGQGYAAFKDSYLRNPDNSQMNKPESQLMLSDKKCNNMSPYSRNTPIQVRQHYLIESLHDDQQLSIRKYSMFSPQIPKFRDTVSQQYSENKSYNNNKSLIIQKCEQE